MPIDPCLCQCLDRWLGQMLGHFDDGFAVADGDATDGSAAEPLALVMAAKIRAGVAPWRWPISMV